MQVQIANRGKSVNQRVPADLNNPGYYTSWDAAERKRNLATVAQYVSREEFRQLAEGVNSSIKKHHYCSKPCVICPFVATMGVCFCPLVYVGCQMEGRVNADMAKLPVAQTLNARGMSMYWEPTTKFDAGGIMFSFSNNTPPVQQKMTRSAGGPVC